MPAQFLDDYLPFLMFRADSLISQTTRQRVRELGFSVPEWRLLATLSDGDALAIGQLSDLVGLPQATVSRSIDKLRADGLAERGPSTDRRTTVVTLTAMGRDAAADLTAAALRHQRDMLKSFSSTDVQRLTDALRSIVEHLESVR